jgi:hypothetical protein
MICQLTAVANCRRVVHANPCLSVDNRPTLSLAITPGALLALCVKMGLQLAARLCETHCAGTLL